MLFCCFSFKYGWFWYGVILWLKKDKDTLLPFICYLSFFCTGDCFLDDFWNSIGFFYQMVVQLLGALVLVVVGLWIILQQYF